VDRIPTRPAANLALRDDRGGSDRADAPAGALRSRQPGLRVAQRPDARTDIPARPSGAAGGGVDVQQHLLGGGGRGRLPAVAAQHVEDVQRLVVRVQHLRANVDAITGMELVVAPASSLSDGVVIRVF